MFTLMSEPLYWLNDDRCRVAANVGNKAAALAQLTLSRYHVPLGFAITVDALAEITDCTNNASSLFSDIREALKQLPRPWIARSSATVEDSETASFAGMFTSVLGLMTEDSVLDALRIIAGSKHNPALIKYALSKQIESKQIRVAALIQALVVPEASGVAFSRHPRTFENKIVIEATIGLADILVDGSVSPDLISVLPDGEITVERVGSKTSKSVFEYEHLVRVHTTSSEQRALSISLVTARTIATILQSIERDLGRPQDIEWAQASGKIFVVQSRSITTPPRIPLT